MLLLVWLFGSMVVAGVARAVVVHLITDSAAIDVGTKYVVVVAAALVAAGMVVAGVAGASVIHLVTDSAAVDVGALNVVVAAAAVVVVVLDDFDHPRQDSFFIATSQHQRHRKRAKGKNPF